MSKVLLETLGYRVLALTDSRRALTAFRETPQRFDLVITDQTMPALTGAELARELLQIRPELPIILCSGYSSTMTKEKAAAMGIRAFALKPLVKKEMAFLIRRVLAGEGVR
jgi:CheY-like chemotaxis protein